MNRNKFDFMYDLIMNIKLFFTGKDFLSYFK